MAFSALTAASGSRSRVNTLLLRSLLLLERSQELGISIMPRDGLPICPVLGSILGDLAKLQSLGGIGLLQVILAETLAVNLGVRTLEIKAQALLLLRSSGIATHTVIFLLRTLRSIG